MKLLLDTHMLGYHQTGNGRYWKNLGLALRKSGKDLAIFLYCNQITKEFLLLKKEFDYFIPRFKNGLYRIFFGFSQAARKIRPDLIHVQNFAPIKKTAPVVTTVHDLCFKSHPGFFSLKSNLAFNFFFKRSLNISDAIICPSNFTKSELLKYYPLNPEKVFVVYEATDRCFKYIKDKNRIKKMLVNKFGLNNQYFLIVGNIEKRKRPHEILSAFRKIRNKHPNISLVFAGPNIVNLKQEKNVRILEYVSDYKLNLLYNGALALILFSCCEGFGLPLVEAMVTKTPTIASDIPVFREIAKDSAFFVKNKLELTSAMVNFITNKKLVAYYSQSAYLRGKIFSWERAAVETAKIYRLVLETKALNYKLPGASAMVKSS